jgi:type I restriction enzyme S subunit
MTDMATQSINLNQLDKTDWQPFRFDQIAKSISERVDPNNTDIKVYIGLQHLDSESLHIKRMGTPADVNGQKLKCYPGDVIFGKRRAYQRKAAIANTEAICSAHAMVLRANPEVIDSKLFPFFLHSDQFMHRAIDISVGSLSPTINWKTLREQDFLLPPKVQQAEIAELLWAMDDLIQKEIGLFDNQVETKHSLRKSVFSGYDKSLLKKRSELEVDYKYEILPVSKVCQVCNTLRKPISKEIRQAMTGPYPYHGPTGMLDSINEYRLDGEYVLIGEDGDHFLKYDDWYMTQYIDGKFNVNNHAHILKGSEKCLGKWIYFTFMHRNIIPHLTRQGATRYKLNKESLMDMLMVVPSVDTQESFIRTFEEIETSLAEIKSAISKSESLQKSLVNQVF